jgi:hypothetical protein
MLVAVQRVESADVGIDGLPRPLCNGALDGGSWSCAIHKGQGACTIGTPKFTQFAVISNAV